MSLLTRVGATAAVLALAGCGGGEPAVDPARAACRTFLTADARPASARWSVAGDSASRRVLDAYCAGVGPALVLAADSGRTPGDTLLLINWNMALGAGLLRTLIHDLRAGEIAGFAAPAYVLLLQEVPRASGHVPSAQSLPPGVRASELDAFGGDDIVHVARELGLHLVYAPSMRNGLAAAEDQGNAILSSLPLLEPHILELPAGIRRRVAVSARIAWPDSQGVRLVSAHLDNWSLRRALGSFGAIRARQARGLAAMLPEDGPLLLGGDLNTWARGPRETAFRVLRRELPRPERIDMAPTAVRVGVPRKLDYFMLRAPAAWHFQERRLEEQYGSDHHPLLGVLSVPPAVPLAPVGR